MAHAGNAAGTAVEAAVTSQAAAVMIAAVVMMVVVVIVSTIKGHAYGVTIVGATVITGVIGIIASGTEATRKCEWNQKEGEEN